MPKAAVAFTGCRLNRYEIQAISESLELCGFEMVPFEDKADLYIINTCGVTNKAEVSSRQLVRRARRTRPDSRIVVTGCYSELKRQEVEDLGVDLVVSNVDKGNIQNEVVDLLGGSLEGAVHEELSEFGSWIISGMGDLTRGFIKIQEGCDRKCTYCTIWRSRGPVRSRRPEFICSEINNLHDNGYREIVLTGVHIGLYSYGGLDLVGLLQTVLKETDIARIRLSSLYPSEANEALIEIISSGGRICPHVHLSVQSADDGILRAMGRDYGRRDLEEITDRLAISIPGMTIGADIITGFPGETVTAFENSRNFVNSAGIHHLHVFSFSPRPDTEAAVMDGQVSPDERKRRTRELRILGRRLKNRHQSRFIEEELSVLFERRPSAEAGILTGISQNYLRVQARGPDKLKGRIVKVCPYEINGDILLSKIV
jgi:threonylcarbamoyladenosine tRNA methylthiotransferase MtaB